MSSTAFITAAPLTQRARHARSTLSQLRGNSLSGGSFSARPSRRSRCQIQMINPEVVRNAIAVYGVVIAGGGIGAFLRSGSKASIISGVAAGIVLAAAYFKDSVPVALGTAIALTVVFTIRLIKTKKLMPAGMLGLLSLIAAAFFAASFYA